MEIRWKIFSLPLASAFTISKGTFTHRKAMILQLRHEGKVGLGEATEISYYGISLADLGQIIESRRQQLEEIELTTPALYRERIKTLVGDHPFLLCAFDCAAHDLYGKISKSTTLENLGLKRTFTPTSFTLGIGSPTEIITKLKARPWPIYKIKLGSEKDIEIMQRIRSETNAILRVDANGGWLAEQVVPFSKELHDLDVEFIEQPLQQSDDDKMPALINEVAVPLMADESCHTFDSVSTCEGKFHAINIKLMKCGGITPALKMIEKARSLNLKVMIGCMTESSIGISAAAQLIPLVDYVDLDGSLLIKEDIATGVHFKNGIPIFSEAPGLGCQLSPTHAF
ncbi:UNVERIFIED_CONTAM: hypothetical protein GTU68_033050 [Idotea baltica]|nr:hypothetical protein [Idotea baltica]